TNPANKKLAEKGEIFTTRQDQNIITHIHLKDCLNPSSLIISNTDSMEELMRKFTKSDQNTMAVVDTDNKFWGILNRERLRPFLLGKESTEGISVSHLTISPSFIISDQDTVMKIMKMFDEADVWLLPMLDDQRKFKGFVSRSAILNNYRQLLREYSE